MQQVQTETAASVLAAGQSTTATYAYDAASGRLKSVIRTGYTKTYSGTTWTTAQRSIGTFYLTRRGCTGEVQDDPFGRVVEVHGPCLVSGPTATDCNVAPLANTPVTQYTYFSPTTNSNDANQLQKVTRYSTTTGPTACSASAALTTQYAGYDARGNPASVTDENGVVTSYTYSDDRVMSITRAGATTHYGYELGMLLWTQFPEGNFDVNCYRSASSNACFSTSG